MSEVENTESIQKEEKIQDKNIHQSDAVKEDSPQIKTEENQANWKKFREDRERDRKARQDAEDMAARKHAEAEALKSAMEALLNKPQKNTYSNDEDEDSQEKLIERKIKEAIEKDRKSQQEEQQRIEASTFPKRLVETHKDFNNICTSENLDYLEYHYPEVAAGFKYMPDGFEKWSSIYKAVKKFVPHGDKKSDENKIAKNLQKPQAHLPTMTDTQPQTAGWRLTEERRKQNWERMQKDRKSFG